MWYGCFERLLFWPPLMNASAKLVPGDFTGWTQSGNTTNTTVSAEAAHSGSFGASLGPIGSLGFLNYFEASWRGDVLPASVRMD